MAALTISVLVACAALAACGGDDEADAGQPTTTVERTDTTGVGAEYEIGAGEFVAATNKEEILEDFVESESSGCKRVDDGLVFTATAVASDLPPDTPLVAALLQICGSEPKSG